MVLGKASKPCCCLIVKSVSASEEGGVEVRHAEYQAGHVDQELMYVITEGKVEVEVGTKDDGCRDGQKIDKVCRAADLNLSRSTPSNLRVKIRYDEVVDQMNANQKEL